MARSSKYVQVGNRKLELSNLEKELDKVSGTVKAELIQYYLNYAPTILNHIKSRPLSLVRYPHGVGKESFFQKNRPDWAPDWVEYVSLGGERKIEYMMASEPASLVWLANLACLELHQMQVRQPDFEHPDYIVYDLDPPEDYNFESLKTTALELGEYLRGFGYEPFVKTTGGKGLHILTPITPNWDYDTCFETAKKLAQPFVQRHKNTTLHIKKEARKGRILIDIYRNRKSQTIIAPYSLRGKPNLPVSMPISWDQLGEIKSSTEFTLENVADAMKAGDAWEGFAAYAVPLHTQKSQQVKVELDSGPHHKSPEQLADYQTKRDFTRTPEPQALNSGGDGTAFTVHRHHASHLHYDLRLEENGVLRSWAVPRGLPPRPGIKRLAVATEDHPMEYLTFEGEIPKGQYGGGKMWIFANGKYEITKRKKDGGLYFRLNSRQLSAEYRIFPIKDNKEWLLERINEPQYPWPQQPPEPMLAESRKTVPLGDQYIYEVKWDGIRAMILLDEGEVKIYSRNHTDLTAQFPELQQAAESLRVQSAVFDAEIVCFDQDGRPNFGKVIKRMQQKSDSERLSKRNPAYAYVFDCLYLDGRNLISEPLIRRREWLIDSIRKGSAYRISETEQDGQALFDAVKKMGMEGIMAKDKMAKYIPGRRSDAWLKVKSKEKDLFYIIGYTTGKGDRQKQFGGLHIAEKTTDDVWLYRGKVGTGLKDSEMTSLTKQLKALHHSKIIVERVPDEKVTQWVKPSLQTEVEYSNLTPNGTLRDPVIKRIL